MKTDFQTDFKQVYAGKNERQKISVWELIGINHSGSWLSRMDGSRLRVGDLYAVRQPICGGVNVLERTPSE